MLDSETKTKLDVMAAMLIRLADERMEAGDRAGALSASDAADAVMALLDLDGARLHEGQSA